MVFGYCLSCVQGRSLCRKCDDLGSCSRRSFSSLFHGSGFSVSHFFIYAVSTNFRLPQLSHRKPTVNITLPLFIVISSLNGVMGKAKNLSASCIVRHLPISWQTSHDPSFHLASTNRFRSEEDMFGPRTGLLFGVVSVGLIGSDILEVLDAARRQRQPPPLPSLPGNYVPGAQNLLPREHRRASFNSWMCMNKKFAATCATQPCAGWRSWCQSGPSWAGSLTFCYSAASSHRSTPPAASPSTTAPCRTSRRTHAAARLRIISTCPPPAQWKDRAGSRR